MQCFPLTSPSQTKNLPQPLNTGVTEVTLRTEPESNGRLADRRPPPRHTTPEKNRKPRISNRRCGLAPALSAKRFSPEPFSPGSTRLPRGRAPSHRASRRCLLAPPPDCTTAHENQTVVTPSRHKPRNEGLTESSDRPSTPLPFTAGGDGT